MKKLFLGVMMVALIITSCNKYANDFQALKDQIAALATQVTGVTTLENTIAQQTATIAALQTAIQALPTAASLTSSLNGISTQIAAINTALTSLAQNGATAASVAALQTSLNSLAAARTAADATLATTLAGLQSQLNSAATSAQVATLESDIMQALVNSVSTIDANTTTEIANLQTQITTAITTGVGNVTQLLAQLQSVVETANAATATQLSTLAASLATETANTALLQASVSALTVQLGFANRDLTILLNATAMYNGDVTLTTNSEVDFYMAKLYQMGIINGNLTLNTTNLDAAHILKADSIINVVGAVIGVNGSSQVITVGTHHFFGNTTITISTVAGAGHWVYIDSQASDKVVASKLTSVRGDYTIVSSDIADNALNNVGGNVTLDYPGDYASASLMTVGGDLILVDQSLTTNNPVVANGTGNINIPNVVIGGNVGNHVGAATPTVAFNSTGTTSITLGLATQGQIQHLTANHALSVKLGTLVYTAAASITAPVATTVDLSAATTAAALTIATGATATTGTATLVDLSSLATSGNLTIWAAAAGNVKLNVFNSPVAVSITGPTTLSIPMWMGAAGSTLNAPQTTTLTLAVYQWLAGTIPTAANLAAIKSLTLGGVAGTVDLGIYSATLLTANITGTVAQLAADTNPKHWASVSAMVTTAGDANLTSLTLGGNMVSVNLNNLPLLTSLTTSGQLNSFTLNNAAIITGLNLGHNAFVDINNDGYGGPGSDLTITNNPKLATLAPTALDWMHTLTVTGNAALASFNFSSYKTVVYSQTNVAINISALATMGTYTPGIAPVSAGNPGIQAIIASPDIMTLKPYLLAALANTHVNNTTYSINIGIPTATTLTAVMNANDGIWNYGYTNYVMPGGLVGSAAAGVAAAGDLNELSLVVQ